ncbi:pitrilysin family protein [Thalassotalea nanhaiensis]|uniref:Pitrilysin family protein n=1 Tax=Thalassotalea nanhaiensis TaxID=3065648 RepID=A0ABY9TMZ5_9GAMM|nr:pitrilysin family protein [Colwelliaceae bacterium SQ345]
MKFLKPTLLSLSVSIALGLSGCATNADSTTSATAQNEQVQSSPLTYVRTVEGIEEYTLENGLKVLLYPDASQPKTLVNVTYRVGSLHENYGETGMAHLLEHMLFKGSTNYQNIDKEFKKRGMGKNASTWLDRTNYFETFDANEDSLEWSIGMEADRMVNATFTEEQLKSEMTVVRNEMERGETSPFRMLMGRMSSMAFLWHNYGKSTIGARSDVENFPFPRLREFYKKHYRPDNAVLTIAGRFDKEKTMALIEQKFGSIQKPEQPMQALYTVEPTQDGERSVNIRRVGDLPIVGLSYHAPSGLHQDSAALTLLTDILGDNTRGRLQKALVETGVATSAMNFMFNLKDSSQYLFFVEGNKDSDINELETKLLAITESLKDNPITQEELDLAKAKNARQAEQTMRNVTGVGMALSEYIAMGDYRHVFYSRDQIAETTLEQVQAAADAYLIRSNRTTGRFIPTEKPVRAEIPQAPDLTELLKDYKGKEVVAAGEVFDNTVPNIKSRLETIKWQEGTEVSIYPKKLRGGQVIISMHFPSGTADALAGNATAIGFIGAMVQKGNEKYSKEDIANKLDQLKSSISVSTSAGSTDVSINTDEENLDETIKFFGEIMATPTFPEKELEVMKRGSIANIEQQRNDPSSIAVNSFKKSLNNYPKGHPLAYYTLDERIANVKAVSSSELAPLYKSFTNINNGHVAVVGDVNAKEISQQLHATLVSFSNDTEYVRMAKTMKPEQGLVVSTETPDKANASLYLINPINMKVTHPDYLALAMASKIFGGDAFTSRVGARIRVKEGYSYSVGAGISANTLDEQGMFWGMAISAPENMDNVIAAFKEEIQKVVDDGFTAEELEQAVEGYISDRNRQWAANSTIASLLVKATKIDQDLSFYDEQIVALKKLTLEQVNDAFVKYIAAQQLNVFKAGDFAKVADQT